MLLTRPCPVSLPLVQSTRIYFFFIGLGLASIYCVLHVSFTAVSAVFRYHSNVILITLRNVHSSTSSISFATTALVAEKKDRTSCCTRFRLQLQLQLQSQLHLRLRSTPRLQLKLKLMWRLKLKLCCLLFLHLLLLPSTLQCISPPYQIRNYFQAERFAWSSPETPILIYFPPQKRERERKRNIICYFNSCQSLLLLLLLLWLLSHNLPRPDATLFGQLVSQLQSSRPALH